MIPKSNLQLDFTTINTLHFQENPTYVTEHFSLENEVMNVGYSIAKKQAKDEFMMPLWVSVNIDGEIQDCSPYRVFLRIVCFFSFKESDQATAITRSSLPGHCLAISYSVARSVIDDLTSRCGNGRYLLPVLDVGKAIVESVDQEPPIDTVSPEEPNLGTRNSEVK
jgi:hypothetical protein